MTATRVAWLAVLLLLLLIGGGFTYWWFKNFEPVAEQVRADMSPLARRNPWLAGERLLGRFDMEVESQSGRIFLTTPPEEIGVLFVRDIGAPLPQARQADLLAWVEQGGHLVVSPGIVFDEERGHPLLDQFGVSLIETNPFELEDDELEDDGPGLISLPGREEELTIDFDPERGFEVETEYEYWEAPADGFPHLLIFPWGDGWVTFLSDNRFWDNTEIGEHDHALLLTRLSAGYDRVWLLYSSQMPSLLQLLWKWAPYLLVSLIFLTALALWRMTERSGPILIRADTQRRNLLEHLRAASEYTWRIDPSKGLLGIVRKQVEKRWLTTHPLLQRMEQTERCQWLAERTGLTASSIEQALYTEEGDGGQLVKRSIYLQRLLSALHPQTKKRT
jgi:hypothetical protein